jgi:flavorubredoxin
VREYVAEEIPVYVLDRTIPLINRFLSAPRTEFPDHLARKPTAPNLHPVSGKTVVGSGPNRIEIYPIHGETSERQMMVYFPEQKLLYGSDPFQELEDGKLFYPQTVSELSDAVAREHLSVERFFMMHIGPNPWSRVSQTLAHFQ